MDNYQRVLLVDVASGFHQIARYQVGRPFFGPVDLGLHLSTKHDSLNFGAGLLAGSIFPGSNRLIVTGYSPAWRGFYISTMGGAALVLDNLGVNMVSLVGRAPAPSILYLNRRGDEHVELEVVPVELHRAWEQGEGGVYGLIEHAVQRFGDQYASDPRVLAVGPAAVATDFAAIGSVPISHGKFTHADTWAGRGGFGSRLLQQHNIAAIIFGGSFSDEDFRDRKVADRWFLEKYNQRLKTVDFEATTKYRFDPGFETGGTLGVNYASLLGRMLYFNYRSIYDREEERLRVHQDFIVNHYLRQFNEETIQPKRQTNCGEPCAAVCKKLREKYKKDYEPYQTMGPLVGIFDQRAAEKLNRHADRYGFDAISAGGVLAWLMECLAFGKLAPAELATTDRPLFSTSGFDVVADSAHNADVGTQILDAIVHGKGIVDMKEGARKFARRLARDKGKELLDPFVYTAFGRRGWMVPNQYWTPGVLAPMAIMGKYFMYYGYDFLPPRALGRMSANLMKEELMLDNTGFCRFHRRWAAEMIPTVIQELYGMKDEMLRQVATTASRINCRNTSIFWESERSVDFVHCFLKRKCDVEGETRPELEPWIRQFEANKREAALNFWYDVHKGVMESLQEF